MKKEIFLPFYKIEILFITVKIEFCENRGAAGQCALNQMRILEPGPRGHVPSVRSAKNNYSAISPTFLLLLRFDKIRQIGECLVDA